MQQRNAQPGGKRLAGLLGRRTILGTMAALLLMLGMFAVPSPSYARVAIGISVSFGPPAIPIYVQPMCPAPGYIWTPGYWAWDPYYGYYWVPGTWVPAPFVGALWTPGYWGYSSGLYYWYPGYWGTVVGFYGGINYGYGYTGYGYHGGYWRSNRFYYNRAANNIRITNIRYYYNQRLGNIRGSRASYNGGPGGINARATNAELTAYRDRRYGPLDRQLQHARDARNDPSQRATVNRGRPGIAATPRPGDFKGRGIERASRAGGPYREPTHRAAAVERRNPQAAPNRPVNRNEQRNRNTNRNSQQFRRFTPNEQQNRTVNRNEQRNGNRNRNEQRNRNFNRNEQPNRNFNARGSERGRSMPQARPQAQRQPQAHAQPRPRQNRAPAVQVHRSTGHSSQERTAHPSHSMRGEKGHGHGGR